MKEEFELSEGRLRLKKDAGGWRHYIEDSDGDWDIHCGAYMEIQLGKYDEDDLYQERFTRGEWLKGRYEARLDEPVKAYLIPGYFWPSSDQVWITVPLGTVVRVKKMRC